MSGQTWNTIDKPRVSPLLSYDEGTESAEVATSDMEHNICRPVNNSDVSLGYQFCKNITFISYIIYNVRYNNVHLLHAGEGNMKIDSPTSMINFRIS